MDKTLATLPEGFVLDEQEPPEGFVLDELQPMQIPDPAEEERQIKEILDVSEEYGINPVETMSFVAGPEPSLFRKQLNRIKEFIRERTGYFEPPIYGPKYREEQPIRTVGKMAAYYGAEYVSGRTGTALDILAAKTKGDKSLADSVARITDFEPTPEEAQRGIMLKYLGLFRPVQVGIRGLTGLISRKALPSQSLRTILNSGLTFSSVESAMQFSRNIIEDKPIDWSQIHMMGGIGVLFGSAEALIGTAYEKWTASRVVKEWNKRIPGLEEIPKKELKGVAQAAIDSYKVRHGLMDVDVWHDLHSNNLYKFSEKLRNLGKKPEIFLLPTEKVAPELIDSVAKGIAKETGKITPEGTLWLKEITNKVNKGIPVTEPEKAFLKAVRDKEFYVPKKGEIKEMQKPAEAPPEAVEGEVVEMYRKHKEVPSEKVKPTEAKGITAYRGDIEKRDLVAKVPSPTDLKGVYLSTDKTAAIDYSKMGQEKGEKGYVGEYIINLKNPASEEIEQQILKELEAPVEEDTNFRIYTKELAEDVQDELIKRGYDGVIRESSDEIIVFDKSAIKPIKKEAEAEPIAEKPMEKQPWEMTEKEYYKAKESGIIPGMEKKEGVSREKQPWEMTSKVYKDFLYKKQYKLYKNQPQAPGFKKDEWHRKWKIGDKGIFYRSGNLPKGNKSWNALENKYEKGVSVYPVPWSESFAGLSGKQWYSGKGEIIDIGSDSEPIIKPIGKWEKIGIKGKEPFYEIHRNFIKNALKQGKPVPREVLEDYKSEEWAKEALGKLEKPKAVPVKEEGPSKAARDILGGVEPITQINKALKEAKAIRPKLESERKKERRRRVAAAQSVLERAIGKGKKAEESIFKSTGLLKGPLSEQRYTPIRDTMEESMPGSIDNAFKSIYENPELKYFEVLDTAEAFKKLIDGEPITLREVDLIKRHFGLEMAKIAEERVEKSPLLKRITTLWRAGLLTGIKTSGLNTFSNLSHGISETAKNLPASLVDSMASYITGERTVAFTLQGYKTGFKEGIKKGWEYLKTGYSERDIGKKFDYTKVKFGDSKVAKGLQAYEETIFHLMGAEDQPFYYGAKANSIFSQSIAAGKTKGLKGKALRKYVEQLAENPTDDMLENATMDAETAVFQNRTVLGDLARGFQKSNTIGEVIVPFSRTPSAVAMQIIHYTPIGTASEVMNQIHQGKFDQRKFSQAFGRSAVGTGVLAVGAALFANSLLSLDYPEGEKERELWKSEGRKPFAIKVGDKWRSVYVLGPAGNVLIIGGYFQKALVESGSPTEAIHTALAGGAKSFSEQTFVVGMNRAIEAIMDPERSFERFFSSLAGSAVPTIVADIARATDYTERRYKGPWQAIVNRVPSARRALEPRLDVYGQDLPRYGGNPLEVMIDATRPSRIRQDIVVDELRRLWDLDIKVAPTLLGNRDGYEILTQKENSVLWRRAGDLVYRQLFDMFQTDLYKQMKDENKGKFIERQVKRAKDFARAESARVKLNQGKTIQELKDDGLVTSDVERYLSQL